MHNATPELAQILYRLIGKLRKAQKTLKDTFRYFDENKDHMTSPLMVHIPFFHSFVWVFRT